MSPFLGGKPETGGGKPQATNSPHPTHYMRKPATRCKKQDASAQRLHARGKPPNEVLAAGSPVRTYRLPCYRTRHPSHPTLTQLPPGQPNRPVLYHHPLHDLSGVGGRGRQPDLVPTLRPCVFTVDSACDVQKTLCFTRFCARGKSQGFMMAKCKNCRLYKGGVGNPRRADVHNRIFWVMGALQQILRKMYPKIMQQRSRR